MTILPDVDYPLPKPKPTDSLTAPSHATLHSDTANAIAGIDDRLEVLEGLAPTTELNISQARLAAHIWTVYGDLVDDGTLLMPLIWNMTGRTVTFEAAKASVYGAPATNPIEIDIVVGATLNGAAYDLGGTQTSILTAGKIVIPAGAYSSTTLTQANGDFVGVQAMDRYLAAVVTNVGAGGSPGSDLSLQLNRLL